VVARRPADQRTPTAADVEQTLAALQAQLAADVIELVALRLVQHVLVGLEIGAGVHPLRVQPQRVEGVGHVVMEGDGLLVAVPGVLPGKALCQPLEQAGGLGWFCP